MSRRVGQRSRVDNTPGSTVASDMAPDTTGTGRPQRAAKTALLERPPWSKPATNRRKDQGGSSTKKVVNKKMTAGEKRKRALSPIDEPKVKRSKTKPTEAKPTPTSRKYRAPSLSNSESGGENISAGKQTKASGVLVPDAHSKAGKLPARHVHQEDNRGSESEPENEVQGSIRGVGSDDDVDELEERLGDEEDADLFAEQQVEWEEEQGTSPITRTQVQASSPEDPWPQTASPIQPPTTDLDDMSSQPYDQSDGEDIVEYCFSEVAGPKTGDVRRGGRLRRPSRKIISSDAEEYPESIQTKSNLGYLQRKLVEELPQIQDGKERRSGHSRQRSDISSGRSKRAISRALPLSETNDPRMRHPSTTRQGVQTERGWKARTALVVRRNHNTPFIKIKEQNADIRAVVQRAISIGSRRVTCGLEDDLQSMSEGRINSMISPLTSGGLEQFAICALVHAAEHLGFNGESDIADRLECGSLACYIQPLRTYVSHRLSMLRAAIKSAATPVALLTLDLANKTRPEVTELLQGRSYIYPWRHERGYDRSKPFRATLIIEIVRVGFFTAAQYTGMGLKYKEDFVSSLSSAPLESEVPPAMVALAATVGEAIIQEAHLQSSKGSSEFVGTAFETIFKSHMALLTELFRRKPVVYHRLMHDILTDVAGPQAQGSHNITADEVIASVDWNGMDEDS